MTREEKMLKARELRAAGLNSDEIGARLGVSGSTICNWWTDAKCADCGVPVERSRRQRSTRCVACLARSRTRWTHAAVIAALRRFVERYGRPPSAEDFNPANAVKAGRHWRAERFRRDGDYPYSAEVQRAFGSWSAALTAAGFEPFAPGQYPRRGRHGKRGGTAGAHLDPERVAA